MAQRGGESVMSMRAGAAWIRGRRSQEPPRCTVWPLQQLLVEWMPPGTSSRCAWRQR